LSLTFVISERYNEDIDSLIPLTYTSDYVDFSGSTNFDDILDTSFLGANYCEINANKLYITPPLVGDISVYFKGVQNTNGVYTVTYNITNTPDKNFDIIIASAPSKISPPKFLFFTYNAVDDNAYIIYDYPDVLRKYLAKKLYIIPVVLSDTHIIKTELNFVSGELNVYIDDVKYTIYITDYDNIDITHYAGIIATDDLIINSVDTNLKYTNEEDYSSFISIMAYLIAWTVDEKYFPWMFNIILIKLPGIALVIALAFWGRGTS